MRNLSLRRMFPILAISLFVLVGNAYSQDNPTPQNTPDDATADVPVPVQTTDREGPEQDDPFLRLQWEIKAWGASNADFRRNSLREAHKHNQKLGRTHGQGAEAGASLAGDGATGTITLNTFTPSGPTWIPIGPTGADYEQNASFTGHVRDSGRARTILPHPTDPNTLYFLTSGGGLWKTTNFESGNTTWTSLTDHVPTTGGGAVAFGRTPDVLYLGLGDPFDQILVGGSMVKSTDGGATWSPMIELGNTVSVRAVAVDTSTAQDIIMVGTEQGMFRSTDSGATYSAVGGVFAGEAIWSIIRTGAGWLASAQPCSPVGELCRSATTLYLSTDAGATWNAISDAGNVFNSNGRTTLGIAAPGDSIVYAYSSTVTDSALRDVYRSTDGGQTWVANNVGAKAPTNPVSGQTNMNVCQTQCWYDQMILVDPTDVSRNTVYIGGSLSSARTTDGGQTWALTSWWLFNQFPALPYAHADFHTAVFKSAGTPAILFGSDGGIFMSTDNAASFTSDKNNGLTTHLFYTIAGTPSLPNFAIGGTQDNGTRIRIDNSSIFEQVIGGDGLGANFSQANTNTSFGSSQGSGLRANLTGSAPDVFQNTVAASAGIVFSEAGFFTDIYAPAGNLDPTGRTFFTFTNTRVYRTVNGGLIWSVIARVNTPPTVGLPAGRTFRSTAYNLGVSPLDLNRIVMGAAGGFIDISTNGGTNWVDLNMIALVPGYQGFVSNVQWADNQTIWISAVTQAAGAVRVIKGTIANPGDSWTTATWITRQSGLPDLPVTKLLIDPRDPTNNTLYAATHVGIYRTTDGGNSWSPYGTGLPNVRVNDMYMPPDGGYLRIATYGRGVWEIPPLEFVSASINDDVVSCENNGFLDNGETGHLTINLHNQGESTLSHTTATVTSSNPHVSFPGGNTVNFPPAAGFSTTSASLQISLNGAVGIETTDLTISFTDSDLSVASPLSVVSSQRLNYDEIPNGTSTESFESSANLWTASGTSSGLPDIQNWQRKQIARLQHVFNGPDNNGQTSGSTGVGTDNSLMSPSMHVDSGLLTISFSHRFQFQGNADGGVIEISTDNGSSWTDIGATAYNGTIASGSNPLFLRRGFVGRSINWPSFVGATINLGTAYANQDIRIRFRVGADAFVGAPGWDIDDITVTGLTANPFTAIVPHNPVCGTSVQLSSAPNPSFFGQQVTLTATVSGGVSTATGTVTFMDGPSTLGSSGLSGGQALINTSTLSVGGHNLTAAYGGDPTHAPSTSGTLVQTVNKADQTITFPPIAGHTVGDAPFTITASASSGLPVSFAILSGPATISGNTITLTGTVGVVVVQASQPGNGNFNPAPSVTQSFTVAYAACLLFDSAKPANPGSTIPIKLTLCSSTGVNLSSPSVTVTALILTQVGTGATSPVQDAGNSNPGNTFRFDPTLAPGGGYIFNLKTTGLVAGAWQMTFTASGDATQHTLMFQVK